MLLNLQSTHTTDVKFIQYESLLCLVYIHYVYCKIILIQNIIDQVLFTAKVIVCFVLIVKI